MKPFFFLAYGLFVASACQSQKPALKKVEKNGMTVEWHFTKTHLKITMQAPTTGWVAIGFNPENQLPGTSLLMARMRGGQAEALDFYTVGPGDYHPVTELGGRSAIGQIIGWERDGQTHVSFEIERDPGGKFHYELAEGKPFHLLMAFSREDDFDHHSMMRTATEIRL